MNKWMFKAIMTAGLLLFTGNAIALKSSDSLTNAGNSGSSKGSIEEKDVLSAVKEVCRVWNTDAMKATLDPDFPSAEAFVNSFGVLPRDAKLVLDGPVKYKTTDKDVVATVWVAIEFRQGDKIKRDVAREVIWTFKRYDSSNSAQTNAGERIGVRVGGGAAR